MSGLRTRNAVFLVMILVSALSCLAYLAGVDRVVELNANGILTRLRSTGSQHELTGPVVRQYTPPGLNTSGKAFRLALPRETPEYFVDLDSYDLTNFTIVTAVDRAHFNESKDAVAGFQQLFPNKQIVYYDLGLDPEDLEKVKRWCNVRCKKIAYDKYPGHVKTPRSYAFKSVIIYEMLQEVEAIFWIDASIRPWEMNATRWRQVYDVARSSGIVQFDRTGHNIHDCTHPAMFSYLVPTDLDRLKSTEMLGSGAILLYRTEKVFREIVYWHLACGLTPDCLSPPGHTSDCDNVTPNVTFCHRYDQSSLDILVTNSLLYNRSLYTAPEHFIAVKRYPTQTFTIRMCPTGG